MNMAKVTGRWTNGYGYMKTIMLIYLLCIHAGLILGQQAPAMIKLDIDRKSGEIDKLLFGNFTEHLGRCVYGGIYEPSSAMADKNGFRKDVMDATQKLGVSIIRWPGGNFASGYHWQDGIGPKENRPKRKDLAWGDTETNQFGTDDFLSFARTVGVEPYICVNLGTGTWDEARNWVEYCNANPGLYFSDLRSKNGHPEPYHVKYWGLGNEIDGPWQMGHRNAEDYCKFALEAAKLMKWSDDSIRLIASGSSNYGADWVNWNRTVLTELRNNIDFISLHFYAGNSAKDHYSFMAINKRVEEIISTTEAQIKEVSMQYHVKKPIYIAFDEYNVWYRAFNEQKLEEHYNMQDALVVALFLNSFIRHSNIVKMANMAQLVNVIAPMMITRKKLWLQTIYLPLQLFAMHCKGYALDTYAQCETYDTKDYKQVPYLDVSSSYDPGTRELVVNVVNRHQDRPIESSIINQKGFLDPAAEIFTVNAADLMDENSADEQKVKTVDKKMSIAGNTFSYSFPAHSFTMIKLKIKPD
jgi:alpha-N-arabinofuranosidase